MPFIKCLCTSCSGHIEFEESDAGKTVACPHCELDTVLYVIKPTPAGPPGPTLETKPHKLPNNIFALEKAVFGITRVFVLILSGLTVAALCVLALGFLFTLAKEKKERLVTYEEVSTSLLPGTSSPEKKSTVPGTLSIPKNVQAEFSKRGVALDKMLEEIEKDQQEAFLKNLSEIIGKAKAAGVDSSKMGTVIERFGSIWESKWKREQENQNARLIARASSTAAAFSLLLILTTLSMVLVLMAIERNTRARG